MLTKAFARVLSGLAVLALGTPGAWAATGTPPAATRSDAARSRDTSRNTGRNLRAPHRALGLRRPVGLDRR